MNYAVVLTTTWWSADILKLWGPFTTKTAATRCKSGLLKDPSFRDLRREQGAKLLIMELHPGVTSLEGV